MTAEEMWSKYQVINPGARVYEAWPFDGGSPESTNELAALTVAGIKTATASACPVYEAEHEPIPAPGAYSVILYNSGEAVCIIRTTAVEIVPFDDVTAEHAYLEGEDDRSLSAWRKCHERVFSNELRDLNMEFSRDMKVVCERFEVVYPAEKK